MDQFDISETLEAMSIVKRDSLYTKKQRKQ